MHYPKQVGIKYKFRAECCVDWERLLRKLPAHEIMGFKRTLIHPFDTEVELELVSLNLEALRKLMGKIIDGHVMFQIVELEKAYTGERKYKLEY